MATADEYAQWIVANKDKQGTPEFRTVAAAYQQAKQQEAHPVTGELPGIAKSIGKGLVKGFVGGMLEGEGGSYRPMGTPKDTRLSAALSWHGKPAPKEGETPPPTVTQQQLGRMGLTESAPVSEFVGGMMTMPGGERVAPAAVSKMAGASARAGMEAAREQATREAAMAPPMTAERTEAAKSAFKAGLTLSPKYGGSGMRQAAASGAGPKNVSDVAANRNVDHIDRYAKVGIGATTAEMHEDLPTLLGRKADEAYKPYEDMRGMGPLPKHAGSGYSDYLVEVNEAGGRFGSYSPSYGGGPRKGFEAIDELKKHYLAEGAKADTGETLDEIRQLRAESKAQLKVQDPLQNALGATKRDIADAMEHRIFSYAQQLERGDPQAISWAQQQGAFRDRSFVRGLSQRFLAARTQLAKIHAIEDSLTPDNHVDALALAKRQAVKRDLTGELAEIAGWGAHFKDDVRPVIGKGDPSNWSRMDFLLGGTGVVSGHYAFAIPAMMKPGLKSFALGGQGRFTTEAPGAVSKAVSKAAASKPGQYAIRGAKETAKATTRQAIVSKPENLTPPAAPESQ